MIYGLYGEVGTVGTGGLRFALFSEAQKLSTPKIITEGVKLNMYNPLHLGKVIKEFCLEPLNFG